MQIVEWSVAARHRIFKSGIFTNDCVLLPALAIKENLQIIALAG
jgi:hypothetical protein